jgi:hypothetical protein
MLTALVVVAVLAAVYFLAAGARPAVDVRALERNGWVVYYMSGCRFCTMQKDALGAPYANYIEVEAGRQVGGYTQAPPYPIEQITGYPFWYNSKTGETRNGYQDRAALRKMAL